MGAIGGLLGLNGGINGSGAAAPVAAPITPGTTPGQLQTAYGGTQNSLASQQALLAAIQAQGGLGNQSQVYNQLQGVVNGTGPNPAQAMLNQATSQNVANQAALLAGQRGAGSNVGLMARQAAMQGANTQQAAIGQGTTMQANQSLNALGAAGNIANTQAGNQINATGMNTQAQLGEQNILQGANASANQAGTAMQGNINSANAGIAGQQMSGTGSLLGGVAGGIGAGLMMAANGGTVPALMGGPQSSVGRFMSGMAPMAQGGAVGSKLQAGGSVPGTAQVQGNSYQNDKVKALLSPGELVVDRDTMADQGPAGQAARFLASVIEAKKKGKK